MLGLLVAPAVLLANPACVAVMRMPSSTVNASPSLLIANLIPPPLVKNSRSRPSDSATTRGIPEPSGSRAPASGMKERPSGETETALTTPTPCAKV